MADKWNDAENKMTDKWNRESSKLDDKHEAERAALQKEHDRQNREQGAVSPTPALVAAQREIILDVAGRFARKEAKAIRHAAKKPADFLASVEKFEAAFRWDFTLALGPPMEMQQALYPARVNLADTTAAAWAEHSAAAMLALAGDCKPTELEARVNALCDTWETERPAQLADSLMREEMAHAA